MAISRQVQLRRGSVTLDLNVAPYDVVAGSWSSAGPLLELRLIILSSTLVEMDRYTAELQRWVGLAGQYDAALYGAPVYVYTKTCDTLTTVAELGATWLRKRVAGGVVLVPDVSVSAAGQYSAVVTLSLQVEETWRRAAPESLLAASGAVVARSDGGVTVPAGGSLTARRIAWTLTTGLTVRVRWIYSDNDCTFFLAETGANDMKALYLAADNKLYIYDDAGNYVASAALTATAGDELDLVFKWDPTTPKLGIWVNGVAF